MRALRVLVVDDEPRVVDVLASALRALRTARLEVVGTSDARDALRLAREQDLDLALADYHMPGFDGLEILRAVRERSPRARLVLVTGDGGHLPPQLASCCDALVQKPFSFADLASLALDLLAPSGAPLARRRADVAARGARARSERASGQA